MGVFMTDAKGLLSNGTESLSVGFGGFTPMALSDVGASAEDIDRNLMTMSQYREVMKQRRVAEAARESDLHSFDDVAGNVWNYVVLDEKAIRIKKCEPAVDAISFPEEIEGLPVVSLGADIFPSGCSILEIVCHKAISEIESCAFRGCAGLRRLALPRYMDSFNSSWFRGCHKIEELVMPGMLKQVGYSVFDAENLRTLQLGPGTSQIFPGMFEKSKLEAILVDPDNPELASDGRAIYSRDGGVLVALAVHMEEYKVAGQVKKIAKKAFCGMHQLCRMEVPDGLEVVGQFAFARTGITEFIAPSTLLKIEERAFFQCRKLETVVLNKGLEVVGENAFSSSGVRELRIPASIQKLGMSVAADTALSFAGDSPTFSIEPGPNALHIDRLGGLYRDEEDGKHLLRMLDADAREYVFEEGTRFVDARSFIRHSKIERVHFCEGIVSIGASAFYECQNLREVMIPESLEEVGEEAFCDTRLTGFHIPPHFKKLGNKALITVGAHHGEGISSLTSVTISPENERFYLESGMLCERITPDKPKVVLYLGTEEVVHIPANTFIIAPYAFNGAQTVRELYLSNAIGSIDMNGLSLNSSLKLLHIDLKEPVQGHSFFELKFPDTERTPHEVSFALGSFDHIDLPTVFKHYDTSIVNTASFDMAVNDKRFSLYEQAVLVIERMLDPVMMLEGNKQLMDGFLSNKIEDICVEIARHDDRKAIDGLIDLGYLNEDNLLDVIDRVGQLQDAAMTGYLLEIKRRLFKRDALDFDL